MKNLIAGAVLALCTILPSAAAQNRTYIVEITGTDTMRVDVYKSADMAEKTPVMIFAFGGSFKTGHRDDPRYVPMFRFLADNGVTVVSTDYRTMLARLDPADITGPEDFAEALGGAIQVAVLDFTRATAYTLRHTAEWGIDPTKVFACGSSAGAITVLQTEYESCRRSTPLAALPEGFRYAGVISLAGAILSDGTPSWRTLPAPMMLFHGDADSTVPFDRATVGTFGLYGSKSIAEGLTAKEVPNTFWKVLGSDHSVSISPMDNHCGAILDFINSVCDGRAAITTVEERRPGQEPYKSDFTIEDYLRSNM